MREQSAKDAWWREVASRLAMVVLALLLLAGAAALLRVAYHAWNFLPDQTPRGTRLPHAALLFSIGGAALGYAGLFLIKRAVLPSRIDEAPPRIASGGFSRRKS